MCVCVCVKQCVCVCVTAAETHCECICRGERVTVRLGQPIVFQCVRPALPVVLCVVEQKATAGGRDQLYTFLPPEIQVFL